MKWIGQHIWSLISRFRSDVYLESLSTTTETNVLVVDSAGKVSKSTSVSGDLTSIVAGTGLSGTSLTGPIPTLNVDASQTQITSVGIIGTGDWRATPITTAYIADDAITEDKLANTLLAEIDANTTKLSGIEDNATADQTQADINGLAVTTVGTISSGTWQGTAIASNYLDSDTAHLSGIQTFLGPKTFASGIIYDGDRSTTPGDGAAIHVDASDITDNNTSATGTATAFNHVNIENPRVMASNALVTTTTASTVYIKGAPVASTNQTFTNAYALNVAGGNSNFGGNISSTGTITGKMKQLFHLSFHDDLGTTKHWMPWGGTLEQSVNAYQEEVAMSMPYGGRIVSCLIRSQAINSSGTLTIGIETKEPGALVGSSWTSEETESLSVGSTDANHAFHFVFDNTSHFEPGDLVAMSIQSDSDLSNATYWYVTTVVEFDLNDPLGITSAEYDSNP